MAKATFTNPFDVYNASETKKAFVKELNSEVEYRELTMAEADAFNKRLLKDYKGSGDPVVDIAEATKISYEKIALALVSPKMTVKDLQALPTSASKAISAIARLIDGNEAVDEEGNSED